MVLRATCECGWSWTGNAEWDGHVCGARHGTWPGFSDDGCRCAPCSGAVRPPTRRVPRRPPISGLRRIEAQRRIVQKYESGMTMPEIAAEIDRSFTFVRKLLVEAGVKIRPKHCIALTASISRAADAAADAAAIAAAAAGKPLR